MLLDWYRRDPDAGIHGACEWVLRKWGLKDELAKIDAELATGAPHEDRQWFVTKTQNHTLTVIPGPQLFLMGSPTSEANRQTDETLHRQRVGRSFSIGTKEVSMKQFELFNKAVPGIIKYDWRQYSPEDDCPWVVVDWYDAARYCRWLSEVEGVEPDQMCFPEIGQIKEGMVLPANYEERTGYRLPTEAEWELACRAGALTSRYYGNTDELLGQYAWYLQNSPKTQSHPSALLKPNEFGLFDMLGNAWEWNAEMYQAYPASRRSGVNEVADVKPLDDRKQRVLRGAAIFNLPRSVCSSYRNNIVPSYRGLSSGFRVARTNH